LRSGPLAEMILQLEERYALHKRLLTLRVLVRTIVDELGADKRDSANYDLENIQSIQFTGNMSDFLMRWDRAVMNLYSDIGYKMKLFYFHKQYEKVKDNDDIRFDLISYRRQFRHQAFDNPQEQYGFLHASVQNAVEEERRRRAVSDNTAGLRAALAPPAAKAAPITPAGTGNQGTKTKPEGCPNGACWSYYATGKCALLDKKQCNFKHEVRGEGGASKGKGKGKGNDVKGATASSGPRSIKKNCGYYTTDGGCRAGDKCAFQHGPDDPRPLPAKV
jgi:hypothetical protein